MGGIDEEHALLNGSPEAIRSEVQDASLKLVGGGY
jgi:hypothetical protein